MRRERCGHEAEGNGWTFRRRRMKDHRGFHRDKGGTVYDDHGHGPWANGCADVRRKQKEDWR